MKGPEADRKFETLLGEILSSTLSVVLGQTPSASLLYHLDYHGGPIAPEKLRAGLESILGPESATIEILLLKNLADTLGVTLKEKRKFDFAASLEKLQKEFAKRGGDA